MLVAIERLAWALGRSPSAFVRRFDVARDARALDALGHRWTRGPDLAALVLTLKRMLDEAGSIEGFFLQGLDPSAEDVSSALESFSRRALEADVAAAYGAAPQEPRGPGVGYFFPRPSTGSACKRLNLYLRWMVRSDAVDLGVWHGVFPSQLIVPLDVHVIRVGQCLGLTRLRSPGWRMARDITASLRALDPLDPVRYDFALCHLGMHDLCGFSEPHQDAHCPLRGWCRPAGRRRRASRRPSGRR